MHRYKELLVWKKAMDLTEKVYDLTKSFPADEKFGLISQMRRSAVSIPSNIAEGSGRNSKKEFNQFLAIASGSLFELETQMMLSIRIGFETEKALGETLKKIDEIHRMLIGLMNSLK